jgi:hypothetical protein
MPTEDSAIARELAKMNEKLTVMQGDLKTAIDAKGVAEKCETKIDSLSNTLTKIIYAQLGLIAAIIGVKFIPQSPVDWYGATTYGSRIILILVIVFLILRAIQLRKNGSMRYLLFGLIFLGLSLASTMMGDIMIPPLFYFVLLTRIMASILLAIYAWKM